MPLAVNNAAVDEGISINFRLLDLGQNFNFFFNFCVEFHTNKEKAFVFLQFFIVEIWLRNCVAVKKKLRFRCHDLESTLDHC